MEENNVNNITEEEERELLAEQARIRREKLAKLTAEGKNPYLKTLYAVDANSSYIKSHFEELEGKTVSIAGRLMSRRIMGKASFSHVSDRDGLIQIYVKRDDVGEEDYMSYKKDYDIGDIVGIKGFVFKTQTIPKCAAPSYCVQRYCAAYAPISMTSAILKWIRPF